MISILRSGSQKGTRKLKCWINEGQPGQSILEVGVCLAFWIISKSILEHLENLIKWIQRLISMGSNSKGVFFEIKIAYH